MGLNLRGRKPSLFPLSRSTKFSKFVNWETRERVGGVSSAHLAISLTCSSFMSHGGEMFPQPRRFFNIFLREA